MWHDHVVDDVAFLADTTERLGRLPAVEAVALGGSRAQGTARPDSDWDLAVYYRGLFDPADLRVVGWAGEVSELGGWGGGVFNGGAWLTIDGRRVDVHYRDLATVEHEFRESSAGRFRIEPLLFHLVGIPTYLLVAELAVNQVLLGSLPRPSYPAVLRRRAAEAWWDRADLTFGYAADQYAARGRLAQCVGLVVQAATMSAHAVLAARGVWVTNEKALLHLAGLTPVDDIVAHAGTTPSTLLAAVQQARSLCFDTLSAVGADG